MAASSLLKLFTMTKNLAAHGGSAVLILDRDRERATVSASAFATANHLVLTGGDAVVGTLVGRRMALSAMVTEAQIAGQFSFDGLDAVAEVFLVRVFRELRVQLLNRLHRRARPLGDATEIDRSR